MLSKLAPSEFQLKKVVVVRPVCERMIEPLPKIAINKQIHAQKIDQIGKRPRVSGFELQILDDEHRNQCRPYLSPNGVGGSANEAFDAQILFQHLEEDLNRNIRDKIFPFLSDVRSII